MVLGWVWVIARLRPPGVLGALRPGQSLFSRAQGDTVSEDKVCLRKKGVDGSASKQCSRGVLGAFSWPWGGNCEAPLPLFLCPFASIILGHLASLAWIGFPQAGAS